VPTDLSVVGFDDAPAARRARPALTTVAQDVVRKGELAAAELVEAVHARRAGTPERVRHHLLPAELVVRASTAPP
jgi:DNA-binding LacI/PurR family transcriptional regulator